MFFRESTGDPEAQRIHREVRAEAGEALGAILGREPGAEQLAGSADAEVLEMAATIVRAGLIGLALWWSEHPDVAREQVVAAAVNVLWVGLERAGRGEHWRP